MKTEQLIDVLSTNVEPVKKSRSWATLVWVLLVGGAASFCLMWMTVGLRSNGAVGVHVGFLALKLLYMLSLVAVGVALLVKLIRPGQNYQKLFRFILVPFLAAALAAGIALVLEPSMNWDRMILGTEWVTCLCCIPLFAVLPFLGLIWALRRGAPTNLSRTGAIAGLVAGGMGAIAYAFHCPDDSLPFIAVWYGVMIALCTWLGAKLGPLLLRW